MAITTLDGLRKAFKATYPYTKGSLGTMANTQWYDSFTVGTGNTGNMTNNPGSTTAGIVPTAATAGSVPSLFDSGYGNGYLFDAELTVTPSSVYAFTRVALLDLLWYAGTYAFNASATVTSPPSYSSRVPGGTDYKGLQLWLFGVVVANAAATVTVTYTDQDGNAGASTSLVVTFAAGGAYQLPLAAGDSGIQKIESVTCTGLASGSFNLAVMRPIASFCSDQQADTTRVIQLPFEQLGLPVVFSDSCLVCLQRVSAGSITTAVDLKLTIAAG